MTFSCPKCKVEGRDGIPEEGPSTRGVRTKNSSGSGKKHTFTPVVCTQCHKTIGMKAKEG